MTLPKSGQEADHRQQLQTLNQEEQELSRQLGQATGRNTMADPWVEPAAVRNALAKDALLIEIVRHRIYDFKALGKKKKLVARRTTSPGSSRPKGRGRLPSSIWAKPSGSTSQCNEPPDAGEGRQDDPRRR